MRIYACTVHVYPCPKTSIDWSSRSQAFVPAAGPAGRASTARAKLAAQKQVSYGSNAWIGGSFFGWHIHIQLGRHITCNDFRGWNLEDHFSIQWYLIWTLGHNCVRLRLLWADFVWLRNFGAGVMMISMLPTATEIFSGPFAPRKLTKRALKKGLILGYPINIVDFSILDIKNCQKKETKNHKRQAFYDYLANDWAISTGEMPWASSGFAFADFLPASALEAVMFGRPNFCSNFVWVKIGENPSSFCWIFSWRWRMVKADLETGTSWFWVHGREVEAIQVLEEKAGQIQLGLVRGSEHLHISEFWTVTGVSNLQISGVLSGIPTIFSGLRGPVPSFFLLRTTQLGHFGVWVRYPKMGSIHLRFQSQFVASYCAKIVAAVDFPWFTL